MTDVHYLGYEESLIDDLSTLITIYPPPFIYINDPTSPRLTSALLSTLLTTLSTSDPGPSSPRVHHAKVNGIACFTPRLLYDTVLNALTGWTPDWEDGCANWGDGLTERWNEHFDSFLHGLKAARKYLQDRSTKGKGKEKEDARHSGEHDDVRFVILVERAERLKENLPELVVPLTRLTELSQLDLTVIFHSDVRWEDIRPPLGASSDPYFIDIPPLPKETIAQRLSLNSPFSTSTSTTPGPYHPSLKPLYSHFISTLSDVCYPFIHDPFEIEYIAAARWPGFVQPVLDQYNQRTADVEIDEMDLDNPDPSHLPPPSEDVRMRLTRLFTASFSKAMEALYPRLINAADWAAANKPEFDLLSKPHHDTRSRNTNSHEDGLGTSLPRMSKFILVAAFLASTNPAKSDVPMFGRGLDEKKRKRRPRKVAAGRTKSGPAKVPQRLLGPLAFPLDRLIAILGALLEENDADARLDRPEFVVPGEYTDMETSRVGVYAAIMELTSMRLLHRTSQPDRIDGPPMYKCGISYDATLALARQLGVPLNDLMWDPA